MLGLSYANDDTLDKANIDATNDNSDATDAAVESLVSAEFSDYVDRLKFGIPYGNEEAWLCIFRVVGHIGRLLDMRHVNGREVFFKPVIDFNFALVNL